MPQTVLASDCYLDDVVSGTFSLTEALLLQDELMKLIRFGGFELRKMVANERAFFPVFPS